ncbi:MAG: PAS domain S-box protein [Bacteroidota bacterium]|nr:PAS domain S-box protein [Bacteroidota bacterium]MDP3144390.1 PAS domain S-box protein [Bacteroidota bacterium]
MPDKQLANILLEQSNDLIWIIDSNFSLKYANQAYQNVMKQVTGEEKKLGAPIFTEGFGEGYIEKWKVYYERGLNGEHFNIEENFYNPHTNQVEYSEISFKPLTNENQVVVNVACQSRDITSLIKSNIEAEKLLDASLDVICSIDEQGKFTKVSAACKELWGYEKHELIGKAYISFVIEEDIEKTNLVAADIINGKLITTFENRYKRKDGGIAYNLWSAKWDPKTQIMFCVARDAREKLKEEELLIESENRFKALVQEGSDLIGILDEAGIYTYVSPTSMGILGMHPEEFIGKSPFDYIHPEDTEKTLNSLSKITSESRVEVEPFRFKNKNGEWRWIETVLTNMLDNPAVKGIVANSRDVTSKKKETQNLKLLESVITNTNDAVLITEAEPLDEPGPRIIYVNDAFTKMTGYTAEEVLGKTPRILQGPKSDKAELARLSKALRNWESCEITIINYKKNGEEFWINLSVSPVADETGWYTHWISIERDVTEQKIKELENELITQISSTFNLVNDFEKATKKLCEIIGLYGKLDWVELWTPNLEMTEMRLISHYVITPEDEIFYTHNYHNNKFPKDEGLIGKVWASGKQLLFDDVTKSNEFIRKDSAKRIGLKTVLGIPLIFNNMVLGVLSVGMKSNSGHLKNYTRIFERLEKFIGSELQRKTIEIELSLLFDTIPDIISVGDFQGRFLRINKPGCELLGYSEKEILQKGFENFIHPEDLTICYKEIEKLQNGQDTFGFEVRFITKAGEILWLSWYCKAKINEGLIYCTAKNITEEKKLRELNRQANNLAKVGSWEYDLIKDDLFWSPEVYDLHDMDPGTFVPNVETAIDFYKEEHKSYVADEIYKSLTEGVYLDYEAVIISRSKKEKWVRVIGSPEFIDGKCVKFIGYFQDTTEHREAEIRLKSLSHNLPGVVFQYVIYPDGTDKLLHVTDGAELIWGFSAEEAMQNNQQIWKQIEKGGDLEAHKKSIEISIETKSLWKNKYKYVMPNNEIRTHLGYGTPTFLADGTIVFNSVILDISEEAKNEELLKQTSKIARIGSWEVDLINNSIFWSDITHEIHETPENFKPQLSEAINFYREDFRELVTEAVNTCIETGTPFDFEAIIVTNKNNEVWVRSIGKAQMLDGQCARIFGSFQDIHERKVIEDQKNSLLTTLEKSLNELYIFDAETLKFSYVNQGALNNIGYSEQEIKALTPLDIKPEFTAATFNQLVKPLVNKKEEKIIFFTNHKRKNGSLYPVEVHLQFVVEGNNKRFLAVILDITERKKTEAAQIMAQNNYQELFDKSNDAIYVHDIDTGQLIDVNYRATELTGFDKMDFLEKDPSILFTDNPEYSMEKAIGYVQKAAQGKPQVFEWLAKKKDGTSGWFEMTLKRTSIAGVDKILAFQRDITERKKSEKELLELNNILKTKLAELEVAYEELEQFAYIASHDLQEPLRMISSFMDQLKRKYGEQLDDKAHQYIEFAIDGAKRMKQIILDILEYSRAGKIQEKAQSIDLKKILDEYKILRRKVIAEKQVVFETGELPIITSYNTPLVQVVHNLLDNAIKYSKNDENPVVKITCIDRNKFWEFCIEDNGIGIDEKYFTKIFVIFQRLHNRDTYSGTGIGLSIVKKQVESLGGKVWIESKVNVGSKFYFTMPK